MITDIKKSAEQKMQKSFEALKISFGKIRTGRAHTGILDHVTIDYYGAPVPISQVANVNLADARTINVTPWEKNLLGQIEKTIRDSDLGLNPVTVGEIIRVPMPVLTEERRRDLTKVVKQEAEAARVSMRNIRRDANAHLKNMLKEKKVAEDEERRGQDEVQKLTNHHISEIDKILQAKEVELMAV
jgi:ribosome recycling factor